MKEKESPKPIPDKAPIKKEVHHKRRILIPHKAPRLEPPRPWPRPRKP